MEIHSLDETVHKDEPMSSPPEKRVETAEHKVHSKSQGKRFNNIILYFIFILIILNNFLIDHLLLLLL